MIKFLTTIAVAALVASPALAAKSPAKSPVLSPARHGKLLLQAAPAAAANQDAGWDPDPNVRLLLRKDAPNFR
jgi:hypothetical protein